MNFTRRCVMGLGVGAIALSQARLSRAAGYPAKPIKMILPYTPGSPNDVIARLVTPAMSSRLGQPVVLDNRPGGGTSIGTRAVMTAEPDGYTLLFSNSTVHITAPLVNKNFRYDPQKDFVAIAAVGTQSNVLVIAPSVPAKTMSEFIAYAKAHPGELNFGYGQGTTPHLTGILFKQETGVDIASVPYKGGAQVIPDMLGGRIHMNFGTTTTLLPLIQDGRLRALAVCGATRDRALPDVPTMAECGIPRATTTIDFGIFGPAGLPADIVMQVNAAVNDSLNMPELAASMANAGYTPKSGSPQSYASFIAGETERWTPIVTASGFSME